MVWRQPLYSPDPGFPPRPKYHFGHSFILADRNRMLSNAYLWENQLPSRLSSEHPGLREDMGSRRTDLNDVLRLCGTEEAWTTTAQSTYKHKDGRTPSTVSHWLHALVNRGPFSLAW